jgi:adenylate kinase
MNLLLLGGPGCKKGTQAEHLCEAFGLEHISSGNLYRENLRLHTTLGEMARGFINRGELAPDAVTEEMVEAKLAQVNGEGFVLDGFPRTVTQARDLTTMLEAFGLPLNPVIYVRASDEVLVARLSGRWICKECQASYHTSLHAPTTRGICDKCGGKLYQREDDKLATIRARLKTYHQQTEPVIGYYARLGLLRVINGEGNLDVVTKRVSDLIRALTRVDSRINGPAY